MVEKTPRPNDFLKTKEIEKSNQQAIQKRKPKVISHNVYKKRKKTDQIPLKIAERKYKIPKVKTEVSF